MRPQGNKRQGHHEDDCGEHSCSRPGPDEQQGHQDGHRGHEQQDPPGARPVEEDEEEDEAADKRIPDGRLLSVVRAGQGPLTPSMLDGSLSA